MGNNSLQAAALGVTLALQQKGLHTRRYWKQSNASGVILYFRLKVGFCNIEQA